MDIRPDNLPEHSAVHVKISPLLCGFIGRCRRIIPQAGMLWPKRLCVPADRQIGAPLSLHARRLTAGLQSPLRRPAANRLNRRPNRPLGRGRRPQRRSGQPRRQGAHPRAAHGWPGCRWLHFTEVALALRPPHQEAPQERHPHPVGVPRQRTGLGGQRLACRVRQVALDGLGRPTVVDACGVEGGHPLAESATAKSPFNSSLTASAYVSSSI
jgi:hypothetical protein